jgi:hypothetical protein
VGCFVGHRPTKQPNVNLKRKIASADKIGVAMMELFVTVKELVIYVFGKKE